MATTAKQEKGLTLIEAICQGIWEEMTAEETSGACGKCLNFY